MMRPRFGRVWLALVFVGVGTLAAAPAAAANKEHQQLMADIRMLQEQAQLLQNLLGNLNESIKSVNSRLDQQDAAMRKAFADQKLAIDNLSGDLRVVREKVDDNNVRIGSLKEELEAVRQTVQQLANRPTVSDGGGAGGTTPLGTAPTGSGSPSGSAPGAPQAGTSPAGLWDMAYGDYMLGQWDLAIQGFESYLRYFPKSDRAAEAQVKIGASYEMAGNKAKAVETFDKAIRDYPTAAAIPDAYYRKGVVLLELKQLDKAREAFEYVAKNFPETAAGPLARQKLDQMKK